MRELLADDLTGLIVVSADGQAVVIVDASMVTFSTRLSELGAGRIRRTMGARRPSASKLARHRNRNGRGTSGDQSQITRQKAKLNASLILRIAPILWLWVNLERSRQPLPTT